MNHQSSNPAKAPPIFDGHNDVLFRLWSGDPDQAVEQFLNPGHGNIDVASAKIGGFAGGFFAMFAPPKAKGALPGFEPPYNHPLPPELALSDALEVVMRQAGLFRRLAQADALSPCVNRGGIEAAMQDGKIAAILHLEGAEAIDPDLVNLDALYALGLRSLGPVWSRTTIFGHGVPFRYPSDGDTGPGLSEAGSRLVTRCAEKNMIVDLSHMTMAGFWDVAELGVPLVATHSNAHVVCASARNLTDPQLKAIGETGGMVGLNYATAFLRPDGKADPKDCLPAAMRHLDHMIGMAGEDHVGLGSDFDGAPMPEELSSVAGLNTLRQAMREHGFGEELIEKLCYRNWLNLIGKVLG